MEHKLYLQLTLKNILHIWLIPSYYILLQKPRQDNLDQFFNLDLVKYLQIITTSVTSLVKSWRANVQSVPVMRGVSSNSGPFKILSINYSVRSSEQNIS